MKNMIFYFIGLLFIAFGCTNEKIKSEESLESVSPSQNNISITANIAAGLLPERELMIAKFYNKE